MQIEWQYAQFIQRNRFAGRQDTHHDIFDAAGKYSASIIPQMIESGGEDAACAAGAAWYGPRGSKVPNFLILQ